MSTKKITVGIDPGVRECGIAILHGDEIAECIVVRLPRSVKGAERVPTMIKMLHDVHVPHVADCVVVEGQTAYDYRGEVDLKKVDPNDLIHVGQVAGACAALFLTDKNCRLIIPEPKIWKKQVAKSKMQARLYHRLGWGYELRSGYAVPKNPPSHLSHLKGTDWKEAGDAILLAMWGVEVTK